VTITRPTRSALARRTTAVLASAALTAGLATAVGAPAAQAAPTPGLSVAQAAKSHPTIKPRQRDKAVKHLKRQFDMNNRGAKYGKNLKRKVIRFERAKGLGFDRGKVTPATWRALGVPYSAKASKAREVAERRAAAMKAPSRSKGRHAAVLREASRHAGKPYIYGGNGPGGFDCSGYTRYVHAKVGVNLPRTAAQQRAATKRISRSQVRPGDLVFVHSGSYVSHVAIYAGNNMWWESSRPGKPVGKNPAWTRSVSFGRV
jgi:cell wall-associated NlpC family hydrolase